MGTIDKEHIPTSNSHKYVLPDALYSQKSKCLYEAISQMSNGLSLARLTKTQIRDYEDTVTCE
jgi:hypothetical protein